MNAPTGAAGALLDARYRVGPVIARGGMSTVYRGTDTRLDRPVAIKVMDPRMAADPAFRTRFEREARSAARIDHPAVVDVHDQGDDLSGPEPTLFLVMELVEGGTLREVLRARGAFGVPGALAVMGPVLAGLSEAHRLGLVHRDVKPENVLISRGGEVKVADFGLVTAAAQAGASHAGMILGTMAYLSPEQITTGAADARSDVYAAGVLLYELLTGVPPYTGDTAMSVAYRHVNEDVPAPSLIATEVPPELDELVRCATRRHPDARPADAGAFLDELLRLRDRLAVPRVPVPVPPPRPIDEQDTVPAEPYPPRSAPGPGPGGTRALERPSEVMALPQAPDEAPADHRVARRRSRRVFAVWIAVLLVLGLIVGTAAWWLGTGRWTAMPSVIGLDRPTAERLLADADLVVSITEEHHDSVAADLVAAAEPAPDSRLLRGSEVRLTISTGRPVVPPVAPGATVAAAEQAVRDAGLVPVRSTDAREFSSTVPEGAVIRTGPAAGTELSIGGSVTLVVSKGAQPQPMLVEVPNVLGDKARSAAETLSDAGLRVVVESNFPFGRRENGRVVAQSPAPGAEVPPGTAVSLTTL
ncbi:Stk1 family PASTA domain-containing Ser/Thr kinase [Pseudonocardia asaccharolytica]|uniref:non-specific serine/threonine protein kinase n=1 Tax=Pseudonocardia asaccharolytica DSM 44247 = NBRC 16224 TaxID=1123024 RepID=A0A511CX93_9PSEU|nr:Stk1 family PASTA domain-containing Ser/Thr kinase [Pseudonocardia asaccharolytica]GEL17181.1 serine/threonine protein kinase [Pseudonocardia asaccharolytica DSM 44247 = NBRC 16224]